MKRIKGFLIGFCDESASVCFLCKKDGKEESFDYIVPAHMLLKNGIKKEGQPFELIEGERYNKKLKAFEQVYFYRPLCGENEFDRVRLTFSPEIQSKLDALLNDFSDEKTGKNSENN